MKCPHCGIALQTNPRKDHTRPLFAILIPCWWSFLWLEFECEARMKH